MQNPYNSANLIKETLLAYQQQKDLCHGGKITVYTSKNHQHCGNSNNRDLSIRDRLLRMEGQFQNIQTWLNFKARFSAVYACVQLL
mmetsp:Transcript_16565/g.19070  ORF Transcript_16565/g.19070 Transcript_16565/m.19070 type:complete len:86 (+) Transcript_16565:1-258(+)